MKKALDFLEHPVNKAPDCSVLVGDDYILKVLVTKVLLEAAGARKDNIERIELTKPDELAEHLGFSSLFGERVCVFDLDEKARWDEPEGMDQALLDAHENGDTLVIRANAMVVREKEDKLNKKITYIECWKPTHAKTRKKLVTLRLAHYKLQAAEDAIDRLVDRTEEAAEIEAALDTLNLSNPPGYTITVKDVVIATADPPARHDITRGVIRGNMATLEREINEAEPLYVLVALHSTLRKLFIWLERVRTGDDEDEVAEDLGVPQRWRSDWREAHKKYDPRAVAEFTVLVMEAYDKAMKEDTHWRWALLHKLRKMLTTQATDPGIRPGGDISGPRRRHGSKSRKNPGAST